MAELPSGTVTLLFTDIEGSTRLLQRLVLPSDAVGNSRGNSRGNRSIC
jgi:hypothetical protein